LETAPEVEQEEKVSLLAKRKRKNSGWADFRNVYANGRTLSGFTGQMPQGGGGHRVGSQFFN